MAVLWRFDWTFVDRRCVIAIAFGLGHAYQGRVGIISTGIIGLLFSVPVLLANSLVRAQVIHAGIDLVNGLLLSKAAESISMTPAQQSGC